MHYNAEFNKRIPVTGLGALTLLLLIIESLFPKYYFFFTFRIVFTVTSVNAIDKVSYGKIR